MYSLRHKKVVGIKVWQLLSLALFYGIFGYAYRMVLILSSQDSETYVLHIIIDYGLKVLYTVPIWYLLFRKWNHWKLWTKILAHCFFLPLWVMVWKHSYYYICDDLGIGHLRGAAEWWDIYIPGLFYILQFSVFHVYDYYEKLKIQLALESELKELALKSELKALKSQLNPHFLYNIFNTINASVGPGQEKTREMIATLSDLLRYQLHGSQKDLVTLNDELEFISKYLSLEKARFGDRLNVNYEIDDDLRFIRIPPMILQPLIENSIRHGISPKIEGGIVNIKIFKRSDKAHIEISDTGVGLKNSSSTHNGIGLSNTGMRLEKIYNSELKLSEHPDGGVCVHFEIPIS